MRGPRDRATGATRATLTATLAPPRAFAAKNPRNVRRARLALERDNGCGALVMTESYLGTGRLTLANEGVPGRTFELTRDEARALGLALVDFSIRGDLSNVPLAGDGTRDGSGDA